MRCLYKERRGRRDTRRRGHVATEARLEGCGHKHREAWSPWRKDPPLEPLGGVPKAPFVIPRQGHPRTLTQPLTMREAAAAFLFC